MESIYIVVEELQTQWLEDLFQYWFLKDIGKEIKGNGEYFPYYYYVFNFDEKDKDEVYEILAKVFLDRYNYVANRIIKSETVLPWSSPILTKKVLGRIVIQDVICPESFKKYIIEDETIEEIFAKY